MRLESTMQNIEALEKFFFRSDILILFSIVENLQIQIFTSKFQIFYQLIKNDKFYSF
jgi:hypothetical protein